MPRKSKRRSLHQTQGGSIRGTVDGIEEDEGNAFINSMAKKYMDQDVYPWPQPGDERVVVKVTPDHTTSMG